MSANLGIAATGRKKIAQGKERSDAALAHQCPNTSSTEGAKEGGELPRGWTRLTMGEVGRWFGGGTPSKANPRFWTGGNIPWVSPKDMKCDLITDAQDHITEDAVAQSATNLVEAGCILIVVRSGILQHTLPVAVASRQVALNQDLKAVKPRENVRSDYLALALKAFERDILHTCTKTGTTVQSLELPVFLRFQIPVAPLPEQRRIVAEIEKQFTRLEAGVAALRRVQANLKRYRAAVLKAACEGRLVPTEVELAKSGSRKAKFETGEALLARILTERRHNGQGRGKYKEPTVPDTAKLARLPEGWTYAGIEPLLGNDTVGMKTGPFGSMLKKHEHVTDGDPVIGIENIGVNGRFEHGSKIKITQKKAAELTAYDIQPGDIVISRSGTVGELCVIPDGLGQARFSTNIMRVRLAVSTCDCHFFCFLFSGSPLVLGQVEDLCKGSTRSFLNQHILKSIVFPLPPLAEQARIVAEVERRLSVAEELEAVVSANLKRATRLRQSILQKAFTGELA